MYYRIKKTALFLIMGLAVNVASAQTVRKVGNNPSTLNKNAVLEVESTTKGFLPPHMTMSERKAIATPAKGLIVWCTDCNLSTSPASDQLCIYLGSAWAPLTMNTTFNVTTDNATINSDGTATVSGTVSGDQPVEAGVVYREITATDFQTLPVLNVFGNVASPTYKTATYSASATLGVPQSPIPITLNKFSLTSTTSGTRPWYFRTYARSPSGISYGKALIYNVALPVISNPVVNNGNTTTPAFTATLTVNAGTPYTIAEYGYCSGTSHNPTANKVVLSTTTAGKIALDALNATLKSKSFIADPTINLAVSDYSVAVPLSETDTYFRYYVIANGVTTYSDEVNFRPVDPISGGSAVATSVKIELSEQLTIGKESKSVFNVHFNVTSPGTYDQFKFIKPKSGRGNTTGLLVAEPVLNRGTFTMGDNVLTFDIYGTPYDSLDGNLFTLSRITNTLSTGQINPDPITGGTAIATLVKTLDKINPSESLKIDKAVSNAAFEVHFNVTRAGTNAPFTVVPTGLTKGLTVANVSTTNIFDAVSSDKVIRFTITGTPAYSTSGNSFMVSRIGTLNTGTIQDRDPVIIDPGSNAPKIEAICDGTKPTMVTEVTSSTNKVWMDRNLGANRAATKSDDHYAYGCLYQWGRGNDGHASIRWWEYLPTGVTLGEPVNGVSSNQSDGYTPGSSEFISVNSGSWCKISTDNLWQNINGKNINNPCPDGYRVPTPEEMRAEINAYNIKNAASAFGNPLKFVAAGYRRNTLSSNDTYWIKEAGLSGAIWTTSGYLLFRNGSDDANPLKDINGESQKVNGRSVRCIKN